MNKKYLVMISAVILITVMVLSACTAPAAAPSTPPAAKPAPATTAPVEVKVAFGDSSVSVFFREVLTPWGKELEERSGGKLKVAYFHSGALGPANEHWDLAVKGLADVSWQITLLSAGVFPLTDVVTLPPTGINSAEKMNQTLYKLYQTNQYFQKEYKDAKVMFFAGGPPQWMWSSKAMKAPADIRGLKIGSTGGPAIEAIQLLGGSPAFFLPMDMYLALQKGTLNGVSFIAEGVAAFKLGEIAKYGTQIDLCTFPAVVAMNQKFWDKLSPDMQKVVQDVSATWSQKAGKVVDESNAKAAAAMKQAGVDIYVVPDGEKSQWYDILKPMLNTWTGKVDKLGLPGQQIMDEVIKVSKQY